MRMAFSRVSRADCSTVDNTCDGINHTSHTYLHHVFVANTCTVLTARVYRLFIVVDLVSITGTEELSDQEQKSKLGVTVSDADGGCSTYDNKTQYTTMSYNSDPEQ